MILGHIEMYYNDKHFDTKEELVNAIHERIRYYTYIRYQRRFGVRTSFEVRRQALGNNKAIYYLIPENKRLIKYKQENYKSNSLYIA